MAEEVKLAKVKPSGARIVVVGDSTWSSEKIDWSKYCAGLTIINSAIHDTTWHADGSVTEINITGKENVRRYLDMQKAKS